MLLNYLTIQLDKSFKEYFSVHDVARHAVLKFKPVNFSSNYKSIEVVKYLAIKF